MYKSSNEIRKKISQAKYTYKQILRFKNRVFVKGGIDEDTGAYPLLTYISSFLTLTRSVFQKAYKEAKQAGLQTAYQEFVENSVIINFFKEIRNDDIHEYSVSIRYIIEGKSTIDLNNSNSKTISGEKVKLNVESLKELNSPENKNGDIKITVALGKRININDKIIEKLKSDNRANLEEAVQNGEELYQELVCDGEKDIFILCGAYLEEIDQFLKYGKQKGFIT